MDDRKVGEENVQDGKKAAFGPEWPGIVPPFEIPSTFIRAHRYFDENLQFTLHCKFSSERIEVAAVTVTSLVSDLAARDIARFPLQQVVREIGRHVIEGQPTLTSEQRELATSPSLVLRTPAPYSTDAQRRLEVARLYCYEHALWGAPRSAIMAHWGIARSTANQWIRQAAKEYRLPGAHSA